VQCSRRSKRSKICFQEPCSVETTSNEDTYNEALEYCATEGQMKMPFYGSHSGFLWTCDTVGGPNPGKPCIFPFIHGFETFSGCPADPNGQYWCSTKVNSSGNHISGQDEWGYCSKNCPQEFYTLLQQGPCQSNHWFVVRQFADKPLAECQRRICEEDEVHFHNECHKNDSNTLCGESQILLLNPFGEGECHCQNDFLEHYDDQNKLHCYEENSQGPCIEGYILYQPFEVDENCAQKNPICVSSGTGFRTCHTGRRIDITTGKCEKISSRWINVARQIRGHITLGCKVTQ
jgi:hypothetical protein